MTHEQMTQSTNSTDEQYVQQGIDQVEAYANEAPDLEKDIDALGELTPEARTALLGAFAIEQERRTVEFEEHNEDQDGDPNALAKELEKWSAYQDPDFPMNMRFMIGSKEYFIARIDVDGEGGNYFTKGITIETVDGSEKIGPMSPKELKTMMATAAAFDIAAKSE